ncbi:putative quinol monooxygenase, partial [Kitasatospora indigofera]|uniref:putative quinol monooxygenase n=1 Tax=Kitasatospora indigofera TaxID=67307 RepID=UPI00365C3485
MSQPVHLVILITTRPGRGGDQIAAFERLAPIVRAEPGCLRYDLHQVTGEPDRFVLVERWSSEAALAAHDVTPHMTEADAASPAFRAGPAEVVRLDAEPRGGSRGRAGARAAGGARARARARPRAPRHGGGSRP